MRVAEAVGQELRRLGVECVFGVVGSGNFDVTDALDRAGAFFVAARHECAAVCMADAYARVSGTVGVASVHQGPGFTNAMTGLTEAAKARIPLLLLAADISPTARQTNFRIDQAGLAAAVGATAERLEVAERAVADAARAYRRAARERRAVVLSMPLEIQAAELEADGEGGAALPTADLSPMATPVPVPPSPSPSAEEIGAVADLLAAARRPLILAGRGAVVAGAGPALQALGERAGALFLTSANGHGLFAGSPWALGISGGFAPPETVRLVSEADLWLVFGASLNPWTTRHGELVGLARVVHVDLDAGAHGRHQPADLAVVGDAAETAARLVEELDRRGHRSEGFRGAGRAEAIAAGAWRHQPYDDASTEEFFDPRPLTIALEDLLPAERTLVIDSGAFMGWPAMYLSVPDAAGFVFNQAFQSIGLGLGAAIGAALARPDRLTVAAVGDGGLFMALGELETAARLALPLLVVVYNDAAYGAEVHHFGPQGKRLDIVRFPDTDFAALARALGAEGLTVRSAGDLEGLRDWLGRRDGPLVVDAKVHPGVCAEWLAEAFRGH
jgi:thiamine pyrophosphate-dependent acetolactate synthase large subunit-like protein